MYKSYFYIAKSIDPNRPGCKIGQTIDPARRFSKLYHRERVQVVRYLKIFDIDRLGTDSVTVESLVRRALVRAGFQRQGNDFFAGITCEDIFVAIAAGAADDAARENGITTYGWTYKAER